MNPDICLAEGGQIHAASVCNRMEQRWRTIRSETRLRDQWLHLRVDHCVTPAGIEISPYYVLSYPDWVHVVGITEAGSLVLVQQYRHAAGQSFLELPGGAVDPGDPSLEHAARRELEEETGFTARRWELVTSLYPNPATHTNRVHFFLASMLHMTVRNGSILARTDVELLDIAVVLNGLGSGLLGHAMHVSGLLLALAAAGRLSLECARRLGAVQGAPRTTSFQRAGFECAKQCTADAAKPGVRRDIIESNVPRVGTEPTALIESSSGRVTAKRIKCLQRPTPGEAQTGGYQRRQAPDGRSQTRSLGRSIGLMPVAVVLR